MVIASTERKELHLFQWCQAYQPNGIRQKGIQQNDALQNGIFTQVRRVFIYLSVCLVSILLYTSTECHSTDCRSADSRGALSMSSSNDHFSPNFRDDKQARILTTCGCGYLIAAVISTLFIHSLW